METEIVVEGKPVSRYTGGAVAPRLMKWVALFVSIITLSLAHPAMVCWQERYRCRHTYIDGKRLKFDGLAVQLIGKYICWVLLTLVTLFIYSFWLSVKMKKWITKHTHFVEENEKELPERTTKAERLAAMTEEERAAYDKKLEERKKTAHSIGTVALVLTFIMPQFGLIIGIIGIVYGAVYREKQCIRLSTVAVSILSVAVTAIVIALVVKPETVITVISIVAVAAVAIAACVTVFVISRKWESYKAEK